MSTNEAIKVVQPDVIAEFRRILSPCDNKWAGYLRDPECKVTFLEVWGAYHRAPQDVKDEVRPILEKEIAWWDNVDTSDPFAVSISEFSRDRVLDDSSKMDEHYLQCLIYWNEFKHEEAAVNDPESSIENENTGNLTEDQKKYFESVFNELEEGLAAEVVSVDIGAGMKITDDSEYLAKSFIKLLKGMNMAGSAVLADRINKMINGKHFKIMSDKFIPDPDMISKAFNGTAMEPYVWIIEGFLTAAKKAADRMDKGLENVSDIIEDTINELIARAESSNFNDLVEIIKRVKSKVDFGNLDHDKFKVVAVTDPLPDLEPKPTTESKPAPKKKDKKKKDIVEVTKPDTVAAMKRIPDEELLATARNILASPPKVAPGFITQAPLNVQPEVKKEEPEILTIDDIPYHLQDVVNKNSWILKIMNVAISNNVYIQLDPILNSIGDIVAMKFIANNRNGTFIPTKSFSVDFGMVINRALAVWPNIIAGQNGEAMIVPFETCDVAYKVDAKRKNGYEFNSPFFNKLFAVGFSGLSSNDISNHSAYKKSLIVANRRLVMITRPNKSNDKRFNDYFNNASFKCAHELDKLAAAGEIPKNSRFKISLYDPENGSVELTTEGVPQYWLTEPNQQPTIVYHGFPARRDGKLIKDEKDREYFYLVKVEG